MHLRHVVLEKIPEAELLFGQKLIPDEGKGLLLMHSEAPRIVLMHVLLQNGLFSAACELYMIEVYGLVAYLCEMVGTLVSLSYVPDLDASAYEN